MIMHTTHERAVTLRTLTLWLDPEESVHWTVRLTHRSRRLYRRVIHRLAHTKPE